MIWRGLLAVLMMDLWGLEGVVVYLKAKINNAQQAQQSGNYFEADSAWVLIEENSVRTQS